MAYQLGCPYYMDVFPNYYYRIKAGSKVIYTMRAASRPDVEYAEMVPNDICADYIRQALPILNGGRTAPYTQTFSVEQSSDGTNWSNVDTITFQWDWATEVEYPMKAWRNDPVRQEVNVRQVLPVSVLCDNAATQITYRYGSSTYNRTLRTPSSYSDTHSIFDQMAGCVPSKTAIYDLSTAYSENDDIAFSVGGTFHTYRVDKTCADYVLYYVNEYGGLDWLVLKGAVKKTHDIVRHNTIHARDYISNLERGEDNYCNEITTRYTANTGWLTDEEASRMHHLLGSTFVFLHDLTEGKVIPVVLTNPDNPVKQYRTEGMRPVNYILEFREANNYIRK